MSICFFKVVIDCDLIARQVVEPGRPAFLKIVEHFGTEVLDPTGSLDRSKLGKIVFADRAKLNLLNRIVQRLELFNCLLLVHVTFITAPVVSYFRYIGFELLKQAMFSVPRMVLNGQSLIIDAPLLCEPGRGWLRFLCNVILVVHCGPDEQMKRLVARHPGEAESDLRKRVESQVSERVRLDMADVVIDNSGPTPRRTIEEVLRILRA